jgi:hypothetical protein
MKFRIKKAGVPKESGLASSLVDAYFYDSYCFHNKKKERSSLQVWLEHATKIPAWINLLMAVRNKIVSAIGLKNLGHLGDLEPEKDASDYKVGDRVGIFTLLALNKNEVILGDNDKHLNVKVSVYIHGDGGNNVSISTVVHVHNMIGKVYMLFVKPLHKLIVPSTIIRAES